MNSNIYNLSDKSGGDKGAAANRMKNRVIQQIEDWQGGSPLFVALAGAPASGKSTLASELKSHFGAAAAILPMDGFHLDDEILKQKGLYARKGAPETFDVVGFVEIIKRIKRKDHVFAPIFDRDRELSRAGALEIQDQSIIIVEGNYLLLKQEPWVQLCEYWNFSFYIDVPEEVLAKRCVDRWVNYGFSQAEAEARAHKNDLRNAALVKDGLVSREEYPFEYLSFATDE